MKIFVLIVILFLSGCGKVTNPTTEVKATSEKITEGKTEKAITTEKPTEKPTTTEKVTEKSTEKVTEEENKKTDNPKLVTPKEKAEITEEEDICGKINADGYGWVQLQYSKPYNIVKNHLTKSNGSLRYNGHRETWYSTKEPGQTVTARDIPGKHEADDGTIRDKDGYICVATHQSFYKYGDIVMTTVGPGKVYDCGCSYGTVDVYTTW